jgi:hypothetical protein
MLIKSPEEVPWFLKNPYYFALYFIGLWSFICFLISAITGWMTLARKFRLENEFQGEKWRFRSAYMRFLTHYGSIVTFGADRSGLYMSLFPLFRIAHPSLLIPWSEITVIQGEAGILFKTRKFLLGREERIPLRVSSSLVENLRQAAGPSWPPETPAA